MADPFQALFNQYTVRDPNTGRYFLPFANTYLGMKGPAPRNTLEPDAEYHPYEISTPGQNPEGGGPDVHPYYSMEDYFNALDPAQGFFVAGQHPDGTPIASIEAQNALVNSKATRGTYNNQLGYFFDQSDLGGAHTAGTTGSGKPNENGLWQALSLIAPAVGGIFGGLGAGGSVGSSAFEGSVPVGSGSAAGTTAAGSSLGEQVGGGFSQGMGQQAGGALGSSAAGEGAAGGAVAGTGGAAAGGSGATAGGLTLDQALKAGGLAATLAAGTQKPSMGTTTTTQVSDPWSGQQPYLNSLFQNASNLYGASGMSPETVEALRRQKERAMSGQSLAEAGQQEFGKTIAGDYLKPESNPYLKATLDNTFNDIQSRVAGTFGTRGGNNYGTSAHQEWLGRNLMEAASPLLNQNYQTERSRQLNAAQLAPSMAYADIAPLAQVGAAKEAYPWDQLAKYQGAISGNYGGTSQTTSPYFKANPYLNALGAGIGAVGLYGMGQQSGLWGSPAGNTNNSNPYTTGNLGSGLNASNSAWASGGWGF